MRKNFEKALKIQQECLKMRQKVYKNQEHSEISKTLNNLSLILMELGQEQKSMEFALNSLKMNENLFKNSKIIVN